MRCIDSFITSVNEKEEIYCKACGSKMDVTRNIPAAKGFAASMAGITKPHDIFDCPISGEDWHRQIVWLKTEQEKTHSATITNLLQQEIDMIIATKQPTK